jgi:hypothetical protein
MLMDEDIRALLVDYETGDNKLLALIHRVVVARIDVLEGALKEIRDVAAMTVENPRTLSIECVAWYAMLAEKALDPETILTEEDSREEPIWRVSWLP